MFILISFPNMTQNESDFSGTDRPTGSSLSNWHSPRVCCSLLLWFEFNGKSAFVQQRDTDHRWGGLIFQESSTVVICALNHFNGRKVLTIQVVVVMDGYCSICANMAGNGFEETKLDDDGKLFTDLRWLTVHTKRWGRLRAKLLSVFRL